MNWVWSGRGWELFAGGQGHFVLNWLWSGRGWELFAGGQGHFVLNWVWSGRGWMGKVYFEVGGDNLFLGGWGLFVYLYYPII